MPKPTTATKAALASGAVAGPLFVLAFLVEGATRARYQPLRHPVSSLALGGWGWVQSANFIVAGLLTLAFAAGLRSALRPGRGSTWGPLLVGAWAVGLLGAGIFVTDPVSGYPPGTPDLLTERTGHGALHDYLSLVGFVGLTAACFVFARRFASRGQRGRALYSVATAVVFAAGIVLSSLGFGQAAGLVGVAGLYQRVAVTAAWCWLALLAVHLLRARDEDRGQGTRVERVPLPA